LYAILVKRYEGLIFTLCLRMMKNREDAEEVAQDVFVKAYQALSGFKGDAKFSSWLYRIAYNRSLDMLARKKRQPSFENTEELANSNFENIENALDNMEHAKQQSFIKEAINQLEAENAFIVTVYYYEEQSVAEIAQITGLTESNIKIKLFRSRKKLFTLLESMPAFNKQEFL
ncbi:MAG: sigma-70 family RNA polymerase sigma factor, partial [Leeuwenhoekiella sp.]